MPIIKSAIKKLRQDKKRTKRNHVQKDVLKDLIKKVKKDVTPAALQKAVSSIDKAAKKHLIHTNKANRLKSQLSKLGKTKEPVKSSAKKVSTRKKTTTKKK
jgi:small subunit ribosomal protein S20